MEHHKGQQGRRLKAGYKMSPKEAKLVNGNSRELGKKTETTKLIYVHPIWYTFIKYCETLEYGEIDKLKIQDGLPVSAEKSLKKTKFC